MEKTQTQNGQVEGKEAASKVDAVRDTVGGAIEKLGHKISDAGAESIGQKIHDIGDALEADHKNPQHPHDV